MNKNKVAKIILDVITYAFIAFALVFVIIILTGSKDADGTNQIFGYQFRVVTSDSMEKCDETDVSGYDIKSIPIKSMVFIELVPEDEEEAKKWYEGINEGDVLTFKYVYTKQVTITHRVEKKINNPDGSFTFHLVGDNKASDTELMRQIVSTSDPNSTNYIIGKVVGQSKLIGLTVTTIRSPLGMVLIIILPSLAIIIYEICRILNVFSHEKKKKIQEEDERKENEIKMLKEKLAELEKQQKQEGTTEE